MSIIAMRKNHTQVDNFFGPNTHGAALLILASEALSRGDPLRAFKLIDRRCRLDVIATVPNLVLRAQALHELGDANAALSDLRKALQIAPEDVHANRRMLEWGLAAERKTAALRLIDVETSINVLKSALQTILENGGEQVMSVERHDNFVTGWVAWNGQTLSISTLHLEIRQSTVLEADPSHQLHGVFENIATIALSLADECADCAFNVLRGLQVVLNRRLPPTQHSAAASKPVTRYSMSPGSPRATNVPDVTIVIPVYKNLQATVACIEAAKKQLNSAGAARKIVVIDDASPDQEICKYLKDCGLVVVENSENLGFAGSVNQVLRSVTTGDILLLNSDAILPPDAVNRLATAAYSADDIATVTPMSNNGELTSYPIPFVANPFPDDTTTQILNSMNHVGSDVVIDLPNGVGFCLYITRRCLDAVGYLPEIYERGYYEDVHFCLDARAKNLRNVCATNVFVPHYGAQSFGDDKRALVVRNLARLEKLFPSCKAETAAFMQIDPLLRARERFERAWIQNEDVILASADVDDLMTIELALRNGSGPSAKLILLVEDDSQLRFLISQGNGRASSNISFNIGADIGRTEAKIFLKNLRIQKFVLTNPCKLSPWMTSAISDMNTTVEVLLLRAGCVRINDEPHPRYTCNYGHANCNPSQITAPDRRRIWSQIVDGNSRILCMDEAAMMFADRSNTSSVLVHPEHAVDLLQVTKVIRQPAALSRHAFGIVPLELTVSCQRLISTIGSAFAMDHACPKIVVLGHMPDDLELMKLNNIFVTGPVPIDDFETLARHYQISKLFLVSTSPVFGHHFQRLLAASDFPLSYFDWSMGGINGRPGDALLNPTENDHEISNRLKSWCLTDSAI